MCTQEEEEKPKKKSQLKNVPDRFGIFSALCKPSDNSKVFPHSSGVFPSINSNAQNLQRLTPDTQTPNTDVSYLHNGDHLKIFRSNPELPIPEENITGTDCMERNSARLKINTYKNKAHKINNYSAILFCIIGFTVTLVYLVLMSS